MPTPQSSKLLRAQAPGNTDTSVSLYLMAPTLGLKGLSGERSFPEKAAHRLFTTAPPFSIKAGRRFSLSLEKL